MANSNVLFKFYVVEVYRQLDLPMHLFFSKVCRMNINSSQNLHTKSNAHHSHQAEHELARSKSRFTFNEDAVYRQLDSGRDPNSCLLSVGYYSFNHFLISQISQRCVITLIFCGTLFINSKMGYPI